MDLKVVESISSLKLSRFLLRENVVRERMDQDANWLRTRRDDNGRYIRIRQGDRRGNSRPAP